MTDIFLKMKHWLLFVLSVALPAIFIVIISCDSVPLRNFQFGFILLSALLLTGTLSLWLFAIGSKCSEIPINGKIKKSGLFHINTVIQFLSIAIFSICLLKLSQTRNDGEGTLIFLISALNLFICFITILINQFIVSKALKSVLLGREIKFGENSLLLLGFLFFPIGLWYIQPKVNQISKLRLEQDSNPINS